MAFKRICAWAHLQLEQAQAVDDREASSGHVSSQPHPSLLAEQHLPPMSNVANLHPASDG